MEIELYCIEILPSTEQSRKGKSSLIFPWLLQKGYSFLIPFPKHE